MKKFFTLSVLLLSVATITNAQKITKQKINDKVLIIGTNEVTPEVLDGVFKARLYRGANQIAFIVNDNSPVITYEVRSGDTVRKGRIKAVKAGEIVIIDMGANLVNYDLTLSVEKPLLAKG